MEQSTRPRERHMQWGGHEAGLSIDDWSLSIDSLTGRDQKKSETREEEKKFVHDHIGDEVLQK